MINAAELYPLIPARAARRDELISPVGFIDIGKSVRSRFAIAK